MTTTSIRPLAAALLIAASAGCALHAPSAPPRAQQPQGAVHALPDDRATAPETNPAKPEALARAMRTRPIVLLGEVHDNAAQHALRLQAFDALLATGARPALLMEQFDRERQASVDRAREEARGRDGATRVIAAGAHPNAGWQWAFYQPFIERALEHGLPIVAVNVSREDARTVIAQGLAASGFDAAVPPEVEASLAALIEAGHCGMVDGATARRMTVAQVARDQFMARSIARHRDRGAVLLAGNGHTRRDLGVPLWLAPDLRARSVSIGLLEEGDASAAAFDHAFVTARQDRPDPCASMRKPATRIAQAASRPAAGREGDAPAP